MFNFKFLLRSFPGQGPLVKSSFLTALANFVNIFIAQLCFIAPDQG
jgi:hypothetical protein